MCSFLTAHTFRVEDKTKLIIFTLMSVKQTVIDVIKKLGYNISRERRPPGIESVGQVSYMDIGSSGGLPEHWNMYYGSDLFKPILVEPDIQAVEKLKSQYPKAQVLPYALGRTTQKATLNLTKNRACSSILTPDYDVLDRFPVKEWFEITDKIEVDLFSFEHLIDIGKVAAPDYVKMDVQGFESEIIEGFGSHIDNVLCVEMEAHVKPIYKNQKTLEQVISLMESKGFFLRHLSTIGIFEYEVVEFDAFFIKRPELVKSDLDRRKIQFWCQVNRFPNGSHFVDWNKP